MFEDLQRILIRKNWITKEDIIQDEESNKNENDKNKGQHFTNLFSLKFKF